MSKKTGAVQCLVKPVSADCNLRCRYCFYLPKSSLYPETKVHRMPEDVQRRLVELALGQNAELPMLGFQGGEPTLAGLDFFKRLVAFENEIGRPGQQVGNSLQTNGIVIDDEWARFLHEYRFLVGLSIDGPKEMHDTYRRTVGDGPTFDRVMHTVELFRNYNVEFNILVLLNDVNVKRPKEVYRFFRDLGINWLQFVPCVEPNPETGALYDFSISGREYGEFLCAVFDEWYAHDREEVYIRIFEDMVHQYVGIESPSCIFHKECGDYLLIEYNGDVYPCDFFVEKRWQLGNIMQHSLEDLINCETMMEFRGKKAVLEDKCWNCRFLHFCYGACLKERHRKNEAGIPVNHLCDGYKMFFEHTEERFKELAREVMRRQQLAQMSSQNQHPGAPRRG